jgi:hypothetical protein
MVCLPRLVLDDDRAAPCIFEIEVKAVTPDRLLPGAKGQRQPELATEDVQVLRKPRSEGSRFAGPRIASLKPSNRPNGIRVTDRPRRQYRSVARGSACAAARWTKCKGRSPYGWRCDARWRVPRRGGGGRPWPVPRDRHLRALSDELTRFQGAPTPMSRVSHVSQVSKGSIAAPLAPIDGSRARADARAFRAMTAMQSRPVTMADRCGSRPRCPARTGRRPAYTAGHMASGSVSRTEVVVGRLRSSVLVAGPEGGDAAVVFVHGNPGSGRDWTTLLERVGEFARCVAPDMPGYGETDKPRDFD